MKSHEALTAALRAVAADDAGTRASASVEQRLRAEVRARGASRRRRQYAALALAATVVLAVSAALYRGRPVDAPVTGGADTSVTAAATEVTTEFLPLAYGSLPTNDARIVRLEVPRTALASFGYSEIDVVDPQNPDTVLADVLVGEDGVARAVRFVRLQILAAAQEQP